MRWLTVRSATTYGRFDNLGAKRSNMNGLGYGVGAKYAVTPNVEVGAEWEQTRYKKRQFESPQQQLYGYCRLPLQIIFFKQTKVI